MTMPITQNIAQRPNRLAIISRLLGVMTVALLLSVDSSLQTSVIFDRSSVWWSAWLYKAGRFNMADAMIMALSIYTLGCLMLRRRIEWSRYLTLCGLAAVYLLIGLCYNLTVFTFWKTYLYDVKVVLCLTIPYLFLRWCAPESVGKWFTPFRIFLFLAVGNLIDFTVVSLFGQSEYPRWLGLPTIPQLLPLPVVVIGLMYSRGWWQRAGLLSLGGIELLMMANRLSLGALYNLAISLGLIFLLRLKVHLGVKCVTVLAWRVALGILYVVLLTNPFGWSMLEAKSQGAETRQIQLRNVFLNAWENIPVLIGKGLGSTWFEFEPIPQADIYSVGTSIAEMPQEGMNQPVKFVFNIGEAAMLYKWGILGSILMMVLCVRYYQAVANRLEYLAQPKFGYPLAVLLIATVYIFDNFSYIGPLRNSLVTSLLAFNADKLET